jgi:hypothetical protein
MDEGLREAIALAAADATRPLMIEVLIGLARQAQSAARQTIAPPKLNRRVAREWTKRARDAGLAVVPYLRPGGELRRRLESGEPISEEEWQRLCGPPIV